MYQIMSRFSIRHRLLASFALLIFFSQLLGGGAIYLLMKRTTEQSINQKLDNTTTTIVNMVQGAVDVSVRNYLRAVAEKNLEIVQKLYEKHLQLGTSEAEAKQEAENILLSQSIGLTGYIYCLDSSGIVKVHPSANLVGQDVSQNSFVQSQMKNRFGYVEYDWANPGEKAKRPKALFMTYFEPWDWIISASSYREEFNALVSAEDFRERVSSIQLGETGYIFIIDGDGRIIHHPWAQGNISDFSDVVGYRFMEDILKLKRGQVKYQWRENGDDRVREKIAVFEHLEDMDWIVSASMYLDEVNAPLNAIIVTVIGAISLSLVFALPLAVMLGTSITNPVSKLVSLFNRAAAGEIDVRSDNTDPDEIGLMASRFNLFMDQLQRTNAHLVEQVEISRQSNNMRLLFEQVYNNTIEGIVITDIEGIIITANPAFTAITGYTVEEVIGKTPSVLKSDKHDPDFYATMWSDLKTKGFWNGEIWNRRKNGEPYPELLSITAIDDSEGNTTHYSAVFHDITEMKDKEQQLLHQATHDALTGLPNRTLLLDRISTAISHAKRRKDKIALFFIDLDNFKHINDSLGHAQGDQLLKQATGRITRVFRDQDTVSRLGGDEFVIMLEGIEEERHLITQAKRLLTAFAMPFHLDGHELYVTTSIGITVYPDDGNTPGTLIKNADMAMYQAKNSGKNSYHMFRQEMHDRVERRLQLEGALRQAVRNEEFVVYYQPKVDLRSREMVGIEALVRWKRPDGAMISPIEFIPLAEETGLIIAIGNMVMERAFLDQRFIYDQTGHDLMTSINLSARQFAAADLHGTVQKMLKTTQANPMRLEFEITESTIMKNVESTVDTLKRISSMGFGISVDDFGTGYSSLAYLKSFPLDILKVDRSFVMDITDDEDDAQIVHTIIEMSRNLGLDVVAEGVETEEQAAMLREFGCQIGQGYLFGKPMPIEQLLKVLSDQSS